MKKSTKPETRSEGKHRPPLCIPDLCLGFTENKKKINPSAGGAAQRQQVQSKSLRSSLKLSEPRQGGVSSLATSLPRRQHFGWELLPSQTGTLISAPPPLLLLTACSPVRSLESSTPGCGVPGATSCRNHSPSDASLPLPRSRGGRVA